MAGFGDAREEELRFLLEVDGKELGGGLTIHPPTTLGPHHDMIAQLFVDGLLNGPGKVMWRYRGTLDHIRQLPGRIQDKYYADLDAVLGGQTIESVRLSHKGRLRLSELRQALRSDRVREAMGILFDGRHVAQALRVAVIEASTARPLAVAFLDLNGMKQTNDALGHDAGDVLVRAYLNAVAAAVEDLGEAFRIGGDEVLVLLPQHGSQAAREVVRRINLMFSGEHLAHNGKALPHRSLCAGIVVVSDPSESAEAVRRRADDAMYVAKAQSKRVRKGRPRPSLLSVDGSKPEDLGKKKT